MLLYISLDNLWIIPSHYIKLISQDKISFSKDLIEENKLIQEVKKYKSNLNFGTYIHLSDSNNKKYLFSTPSKSHYTSEVMEKTKHGFLKINFYNYKCNKNICFTKKSDGYFLSFEFPVVQKKFIANSLGITASCQYEGIYRREYTNMMEVQIAFNHCSIFSIRGKESTEIHPTLKKLYSNE